MRGALRPAGSFSRGFNCVANIFAIAKTHFAEQAAAFVANLHAVAGIRPRLLASDVKLHGAVDIKSEIRILRIWLFGWN